MSHLEASSTSASLLLALRDPRDGPSWQTFVNVYGRLIYQHARRQGLQDADAADVTQEVLLEVARCIRSFEYDPAKGRFRNWLGLLTQRRVYRRTSVQARRDVAAGGDAPQPEMPDDNAVDASWIEDWNDWLLRTALERVQPHFEENTWRAFEESWVKNRPAAEVAGALGVGIDNVYLARSRVLKKLEAEIRYLAEDMPHF